MRYLMLRNIWDIPPRSHRFHGLALIAMCIFFAPLKAQEIINFNANSYKSALPVGSVGDWIELGTWENWDGTNWVPALTLPDQNSDVFIEQGKEIRLTQNQEVRHLYLFSAADAGRKLNLQNFNLEVYGSLRCFSGVEGNFFLEGQTSALLDWIYPETGNIVFRGATRIILERDSWSANNLNSRFGVIFAPEDDQILFVNAALKANNFVIQSGAVNQLVNTDGDPATSTFSFNTQMEFGPDAYGDFIIEPGATLVSSGTGEFGQIVRRSESRPAANFHLKEGGNLILYGVDPIFEAENILLEGNVSYSGGSGIQQFIRGSLAGVQAPSLYNNLYFQGNGDKVMPAFLEIKGDFEYIDGGITFGDTTTLLFSGETDQNFSRFFYQISNLEIDKPSGTLFIDTDLSIRDQLTMTSGNVDFMENNLSINSSGEGGYTYVAGRWINLSQFYYQNLSPVLNDSNGTFPFYDTYLEGDRSVFLTGTNTAPNADLTIRYIELPEVNWDPGFNDNDATPILYKLNSYFTIESSNYVGSDALELHISADNLLVVDELDLRIVSDAKAAPGQHLPGEDEEGDYARRSITFEDLNNTPGPPTFTVGSTGILSTLPVTWLSYSAEEVSNGNLISWSTSMEVDNMVFIILRSTDEGENFEEIGEAAGAGNSSETQHYSFLDKLAPFSKTVLYQIKQVDMNHGYRYSPVFTLQKEENVHIGIFPNPYTEGDLNFQLPKSMSDYPSVINVVDQSGKILMSEQGKFGPTTINTGHQLKELGPGLYIIRIAIGKNLKSLKWLKK